MTVSNNKELLLEVNHLGVSFKIKNDKSLFFAKPQTLKAVKDKVAVIKGVEWARTPHSFSHIFAGGYAAGYYRYLWAEVLSADAFSRFEEEGIFNPVTGKSFLDEILTRGGSEEPMVLFKRFRGREPQLDALLRHKGIAN